MKELKAYQEKAIGEITDKLKKLIMKNGNYSILFKSPTGSGKTLMSTEALKNLVTDITIPFDISYVWISVRMLHEQSRKKLNDYLVNTNTLKTSYFEELQDRKIGKNEILFINWESISRKNTNIFVRENEQDFNLKSVIRNTKADGRKILLVIDESHHTANTERSLELIDDISPDVVLEVTATPVTKIYNEQVTVYLNDVRAEQMIKSEIAINPEFLTLKVGKESSNEIVLKQAIDKRKHLKGLLENEGSKLNPLLLIQLPDSRGEMDTFYDDITQILDNNFDINEDNGKLATWLSGNHSPNLSNLEKDDNDVEVLIFKQAIALGWDCPRASILVIFRELRSFTFTIQTIGRIMRMPEFRYYSLDDLNKAYVFTNLENVLIEEDELKDYITQNESRRVDKLYSKIHLKSESVKRIRERTRLSGEFVKIFQRVADQSRLKESLNPIPSRISNYLIANGKIENLDAGELVSEGNLSVNATHREINRRFDLFVWKNCTPYAPVDSSDRIKSALYSFIKSNFEIDKYTEKAQRLVLDENNEKLFTIAIAQSKDIYREEVVEKTDRSGEIGINNNWEIPEFISYNEKYTVFSSKRSVMQPFYIYTEASGPEKEFMKLLDKSKSVDWWFKNREGDPKYFSVVYNTENGYPHPFYVDFIVKFTDGRIGLFDTKKGSTASEEQAKYKAESLQRYIREENQRSRNFFGGIVVPTSVGWKISESEQYTDNLNNPTAWKPLLF
jgi:type III restriction enzyme